MGMRGLLRRILRRRREYFIGAPPPADFFADTDIDEFLATIRRWRGGGNG